MSGIVPFGLRMLIVEDEAMVAMMVEDILLDLGCVVMGVAGSVKSALLALESQAQRLDGAILDVNLGGEKVFPVAEALARNKIPFFFATGYGSSGLEGRFKGAPVIAKPFEVDHIRRAIVEARISGRGDEA